MRNEIRDSSMRAVLFFIPANPFIIEKSVDNIH